MSFQPSLSLSDVGGPAPFTVQLSPEQAIRVYSIAARWEGIGASGSFHPAVSIYSQDDVLVSRTRPEQVFAVGDEGVVTYAPFLHSETSVAASIAFPAYTILELSGDYNVWKVSRSPGQDPTRVTANSFDERTDPVASPDGTMIAYVQRIAGERVLKVINADGSGDAIVDDSGAAAKLHPYWAPDSSKIIYDVAGTIRTRAPDGSGSTDILTKATIRRPQFSPDGSKIAYQLQLAGDDELWTVNADGSGDTKVATVKNVSGGFGHSWSNDGAWIAYGDGPSGGVTGNFYKVRPDGTGTLQLTTGALTGQPGITKYAWEDDDSAIFVFLFMGGVTYRLHRIPADGSGEVAVLPNRDTNGQVGIGQAYVFGERVYFGQRNPGKLESVAFDGSGYRVEQLLATGGVGDQFYLGTGFESNL